MFTKTVENQIEVLAQKSTTCPNENGALKYSQAALNLAHALAVMICNRQEERS